MISLLHAPGPRAVPCRSLTHHQEQRHQHTTPAGMIGKYGGFNPPRYSFQLRAASIALGAVAWLYYFGMATEHGSYQFVCVAAFR